jgi:hypothetical protein
MARFQQNEVTHAAVLGVAVLLEALAILSVVSRSALVPFVFPNVVSVAVYLLPGVVGLLARRLESAILFSVLPFVVLVAVYLAVTATPFILDLDTLGLLAGRVASPMFLFGGMGLLGWLLRQVLLRAFGSGTPSAQGK